MSISNTKTIKSSAHLQIGRVDVLGGAQQQLGDGDAVQVGERGVRAQRGAHAAQVAHVDAARVQRLRQPRAVHGRRRVLQALAHLPHARTQLIMFFEFRYEWVTLKYMYITNYEDP